MNEAIRSRLLEMQDETYRAFQSRLMPTVNPDRIIGVRTPMLRAYARKLRNTPGAEAFLSCLPHRYYEEDNLHAFLIEFISDYDACIAALTAFLPYVDNWATCDGMNPRALAKHPGRLLSQIQAWISSGQTYTVRFGLGMLMRYFLDDRFQTEYLDLAAGVRSDEYYVNMMVAWFFATALAKQYDAALPCIENRVLPAWIHNKAVQKAVESDRISAEQKAYLKSLKISTRKPSYSAGAQHNE